MWHIKTRFEEDKSLTHIDVLVRAPSSSAQTEALLARIADEPSDVLTVTGEDGALRRITAAEVVSVSVAGKLSRVVTEDASFTVRQTLQSIEDALDRRTFVRISRFELVNLDKVSKYDFTLSGTLRLELVGGMETWASRRCIPEIRRRLNRREGESC